MSYINALKVAAAITFGGLVVAGAVKMYAEHKATNDEAVGQLAVSAAKAMLLSHVTTVKQALMKHSDLFDYNALAKEYYAEILEASKDLNKLDKVGLMVLLKKFDYIKINVLDTFK